MRQQYSLFHYLSGVAIIKAFLFQIKLLIPPVYKAIENEFKNTSLKCVIIRTLLLKNKSTINFCSEKLVCINDFTFFNLCILTYWKEEMSMIEQG